MHLCLCAKEVKTRTPIHTRLPMSLVTKSQTYTLLYKYSQEQGLQCSFVWAYPWWQGLKWTLVKRRPLRTHSSTHLPMTTPKSEHSSKHSSADIPYSNIYSIRKAETVQTPFWRRMAWKAYATEWEAMKDSCETTWLNQLNILPDEKVSRGRISIVGIIYKNCPGLANQG